MIMTEDQQKTVTAKIIELLGHRKCAVCENNKWELDSTIFQIAEYHGGPKPPSERLKPVLALSCTKCGNTVMLSAIQLGVVERAKKESTEGGKHE